MLEGSKKRKRATQDQRSTHKTLPHKKPSAAQLFRQRQTAHLNTQQTRLKTLKANLEQEQRKRDELTLENQALREQQAFLREFMQIAFAHASLTQATSSSLLDDEQPLHDPLVDDPVEADPFDNFMNLGL